MPLYEYKCQSCGETFEVIQKFSDAPLTTHEKCGGHVERVLSPPALQFKGSGWYVTDYGGHNNGKSQPSKDAQKETKSESSSSSQSASKTETKTSATSTSTSDKKV